MSAQARTGPAVCCFTRAWENHECWWPTWRYWMRVDAAALQRYLLFPTRLLQVFRLLATLRVSLIPQLCPVHALINFQHTRNRTISSAKSITPLFLPTSIP